MVEVAFAKEGCILLDKYQKNDIRLKYICPAGHHHSISWANFRKGGRCPFCSGAIITQEWVERAFKEKGRILLGKYVDCNTKMEYMCANNHLTSTTWNSFVAGVECWHCAQKISGEKRRLSAEMKEIRDIRNRIAMSVATHLKKRSSLFDGSKTSFAATIAESVFVHLGFRPLGERWEIDHIVPQSFFDFRNTEEIKACWNPCNLRWMQKLDNIRRGNKLEMEEVEKFTSDQLSILDKASLKPKKWVTYLARINAENSIKEVESSNYRRTGSSVA